MATAKKTLKGHLIRLWQGWGKPLLVVVLVLGSFRSAVADWNDVPSGSMRPTILEGERIFVNKLAYDLKVPFTTWHVAEWADPQAGEIVICYSPADGTRLVKRIIAGPGDRLEMVNNQLIINGLPTVYGDPAPGPLVNIPGGHRLRQELVTEQLGDVTHPVMLTPGLIAQRDIQPLTIPAGSYFVMGDNRDQSADSRMFGFVPREDIVGRASAVVISVDPERYYRPRWSRFFTGLR